VIEFSHDATVEGQHVPAGKYGLFFTINQDDSGEVILSKDFRSWEASSEAGMINCVPKSIARARNRIVTYDFESQQNTGELVLNWRRNTSED
jgi:hypothetical protein